MNLESTSKEEPILEVAFEEDKNDITEEQPRTPSKRDADEVTIASSAWKSEAKSDDEASQHSEEEQSTRLININRANTNALKCLCCTRRPKKYPNNEVKTSKYNFLSFLPLNLMV